MLLGTVVLSGLYGVVALVTALLAAHRHGRVRACCARSRAASRWPSSAAASGILAGSAHVVDWRSRVPETARAILTGALAATLAMVAGRGRAAGPRARPGPRLGRERAVPAARRHLRRAALHRARRGRRPERRPAVGLLPARSRLRRRHRHGGLAVRRRARPRPGVPAARCAALRGVAARRSRAPASPSRCWSARSRRCWWSAASRPTASRSGRVRGLGSGVVGGVLLTVLVMLAGGAVGPGRMADVGASTWCPPSWRPRSRWASAVSSAASAPPRWSRRR